MQVQIIPSQSSDYTIDSFFSLINHQCFEEIADVTYDKHLRYVEGKENLPKILKFLKKINSPKTKFTLNFPVILKDETCSQFN